MISKTVLTEYRDIYLDALAMNCFREPKYIDVECRARAFMLGLDFQGDLPAIWYHHDIHASDARRRLLIVGTGWPCPRDPGTWLGVHQHPATFHPKGKTYTGYLVFHFFDQGEVAT